MAGKKTLQMRMEPKQLFRSIAGFKYQLAEAVGDLADNSVDADADKLWIYASKSEIVIADNGAGMSKEDLANAITPWAKAEERHRAGKRGVFGIGLKSASFSLGNSLEIHTRRNNEFLSMKLKLNELINKEDTTFEYSDEETELFQKFKLKSGTVIRITQINTKKITQPALDKLKNEIGLMFFRLIEKGKVTILLNDEKVTPLSPLLPDLKKGAPQNYYHDYGVTVLEHKREDGTKSKIKVHPVHIGRGNLWSNNDRNKYRFFLRKGLTPGAEFSTGLLKLDQQGIYLMRNDRLITLGGWYGIVRSTTLLHHGVSTRVLIEYNSEDDELIGVDHTKTKPDFSPALMDELRDKVLTNCLRDSEARFRKESADAGSTRQASASKELKNRPMTGPEWARTTAASTRAADKVDPERARREKELESKQKKEAEEREDWFRVVDKLAYNGLWATELNKEKKPIVLLNEKHPGYEALYLESDPDQLRMNLNFFFYNLALFEGDVDSLIDDLSKSEKELLQRMFKELRKFVSRQMLEITQQG
jgi:hypothetical protein